LRFLDKVFNNSPLTPLTKKYTWAAVLKIVGLKKKPLTGIIDLNIRQISKMQDRECEE